jgi:hypothetical protein
MSFVDIMKQNSVVKWMYSKYRLRRILRTHYTVSKICRELLNNYFAGDLRGLGLVSLKEELVGKQIIWQYWGQGYDTESMPEIVRICLNSVDCNKGNYEIIRLSDANVKEYIDFPEEIFNKVRNGLMSRTFFSDLLRVSLLSIYGGVWLDATILLTDSLPAECNVQDKFFMYQRLKEEKDKRFWENTYAYYWSWHPEFKVRVLNSVIAAPRGDDVMRSLADILGYWWMHNEVIPDYFFFQILFQELVSIKPELNCKIVSDCKPHLLQMKVNNGYELSLNDIMSETSLHKMSYYTDGKLGELKILLKDVGSL